jgi:hypothetical protein
MIAETAAKFRYDDEKHEYWLGDTKLPHPTGVLARWSDFSSIPPDKLFVAREFGTTVHKYIAAFNNGTLDMDAKFPADETFDLGAIVKGWERVYMENVYAMSAVEKTLLNKEFRYACTVDAIAGNTVIDYKPMSRVRDPKVGVQLAANAMCAISEGLVDMPRVHLVSWHYDPFGKWKKVVWPFKENCETWIHCLSAENRLGGK